MKNLIAIRDTFVLGQYFKKFDVFSLENSIQNDIDISQNYTNNGFIEQAPPHCEKKYWTIRDGQVVEMTEGEKAQLHEQERQAAIQSYEQANYLRFENRCAFGQELVKKYAFANYKNSNLSKKQIKEQYELGSQLVFFLEKGSLLLTIDLLKDTPEKFFLNGEKTQFIQTIQNYLTNEPPLPQKPE